MDIQKQSSKKQKKVLLVLLSTLFLFSGPSFTHAAPSFTMFGGMVLFSMPCPCSASSLLIIGPPTPAVLTYQWGASQKANFMLPAPGVWTLGYFIPGAGICSVYVGVGCATIPTEGLITPMVGTSF